MLKFLVSGAGIIMLPSKDKILRLVYVSMSLFG